MINLVTMCRMARRLVEKEAKKRREIENKDLDRVPLSSSVSKEGRQRTEHCLTDTYRLRDPHRGHNIYCLDKFTNGLKKRRMER